MMTGRDQLRDPSGISRRSPAGSLMLLLLLFMIAGCGTQQTDGDEEGVYQIYCLSNDETELISTEYHAHADSSDTTALIEELLAQLGTIPELLEYEAPLSGAAELLGYTLHENLLTLNFSETYTAIDETTEILLRAAVVRTCNQIPGVDTIAFQIMGTPLTNAHGEVVGNMTADRFIYNAGREINTYEKVRLTLYFADDTGTKLIPVYRTVVYNSNILMERLVVEQLIAGPKTDGSDLHIGPTINPDSGIINISVRDGICYVNLDESFLVQPNPVTAEVALYSIVNSLAELSEVSRVQLSVQGDTAASFMDSMPLSAMYTRNLDVVFSANEGTAVD